jgi:16S rRNA (cytosine967-C5)-methyltransferase
MKTASYIKSAAHVLARYNGGTPFSPWIKQYFKENKKFGSRDRKIVTHLCYCYFRLGRALEDLAVEERIAAGLFLTSHVSNDLLLDLDPHLNAAVEEPLEYKLKSIGGEPGILQVFPFLSQLSTSIPASPFASSHLVQPNLYLRVRPGKAATVMGQLSAAAIPFKRLGDTVLSLPNNSKTDTVLRLDADAVVQDISSQEVLQPFEDAFPNRTASFAAWDCCAASGGKSILLKDTYPNVSLTVSDVRPGILRNLHERFQRAGISGYDAFVKDVGGPQFTMSKLFDLVLCDAPCSGSGTWSRSPENLKYFNEEKIEEYANRQKWIGMNASKAVRRGGHFLYITCSVFEKENEHVVAHLQQHTKLELQSQAYFRGYERRGDTLFAALFSL